VTLLHASCVAIGGHAVLIVGPSGAGKSDLALRLIDRGAVLVSDDQVELARDGARLLASAPATIAGKMEVRGIGIVAMAHSCPMPVALIIDLAAPPERMPDPRVRELCGVEVPVFALAGFEASSVVKVELMVRDYGL
jgi:serine kinase of HPr protein (carbohydrate metabolism regulator)